MAGKEGPLPGIDLEHYVRLLLRQKWFLVLPCIMGVVLMAVYSMTLTNLYKATSSVLVEPPSLPKEFMKRTVEYGPETYVRTLVEQVKSVSRLEKVINEYNLYPDMRDRGKTVEEIVGYMRNQIEIVRRGSDTFSISYIGDDPQKVQDVTNRLADLFIEENVKFRLQKSEKNVMLLESQAKKLRDEVMAQERLVEQFKAKNLNRLPEQQAAIQTQLGAAQQQLESNAQTLATARIRASNLQQRLNSLSPTIVTSYTPATSASKKALEKARGELARLKAQYSDRHPDVKLKQAEVDALESALAGADTGSEAPKRRVSYSSEYRRTKEEFTLVQGEIERMEGEDERLRGRVDDLNARLEALPAIGLELSELTKGLKVKRDQADTYQKKATDAFASLAMEESNQGSQFRSLDRARKPSKPISPNRPMLVFLGGVAGLGLGVVLMIGLDVLFRPFLDEQDLARFTGVQVLVSIPQVGPFPSEWQRFRGQMSSLIRFLLGSLSPVGAQYHRVGVSPPVHSVPGRADPRGEETLEGDVQRESGPSGTRGPGKVERRQPPLRKIRPVTTVLRGNEDKVPWFVPPKAQVPDENAGHGGNDRRGPGRVVVGRARLAESIHDRSATGDRSEMGAPSKLANTVETRARATNNRPRLVAPADSEGAGGWARSAASTNTHGTSVDGSEGGPLFGSAISRRQRFSLASSHASVEEAPTGEITQEIPRPPPRTADRKS